MTIALLDLITPLTRQQVEKSIYDTMAGLGVNTTGWKAGSVVRAMTTGLSIVGAAFSKLQSTAIMNQYLDYSSGDWLKALAKYGYGVDAFEATFATGQITLVNSGGGVYNDVAIGDYVAQNPDTGKTYRNAEAFSLDALSSVTFAIEAIEAGSASTSGPNQITASTTPLNGVSSTNALAVVGEDPETDPDIRTRCRQKLGSLSPNGPWDAYAYFARTAVRADGSNVGVKRTRNTKDGYGNLTTYVATATGPLSTDDLAIVDELIQRKATPLAVTATTLNAAIRVINVVYTVTMYNTSGSTEQQIKDAIANQIATFFSTEPIGGNEPHGVGTGRIYSDAIRAKIAATYTQIFHVGMSSPGLDSNMLLNEIPVLGSCTGTIIQVPPSAGY